MGEYMSTVLVTSFYQFIHISSPVKMVGIIKKKCVEFGLKGSILISTEGINGSIAGNENCVCEVIDFIKQKYSELMMQESRAQQNPFFNLKVKHKKEIINIGAVVDPTKIIGEYVEPQDWNQLISDPDVMLIDTRNDYEIEIGTFQKAINPKTRNFREFSDWVKKELPTDKSKKIVMFCTGGIRCEKATSYVKEQGFSNVFHLKGGILRYLSEIDEGESLWDGYCFVFDQRIGLGHRLVQGNHDLCYGCGFPLTEQDKNHVHYQCGTSCHRCFSKSENSNLRSQAEKKQQNFGVGQRHRQ